MSDNSLGSIVEVANWAKDARDEDSKRYFYHFSDVSLIENGAKNYVIGRKGTGKTAIAEYIRLNTSNNIHSRLLSFKNFPFNLLYMSPDSVFTKPNQYITIWEYVIYTCICNMMASNRCVNFDAREKLSKIFDFDVETALPNAIRKITDRGFGINIFGLGGNIDSTSSPSSLDIPIQVRKEIVENYVVSNIDSSNYYILFDALDEDYKDILQPDRRDSYFELLVGLFKAAQNVRQTFKNIENTNVVPVIFLRDEIFDLCRDPDKNKWLDRAITLNWNYTRLQSLVSFRLSRAINPNMEALPFHTVWPRFFTSSTYRGHRRRREELFKIMLRSTFDRPRDIINFISECSEVAKNLGESRISNDMIAVADAQQSEYMRREVIDELYSVVDDISEVLDLLVEIGKPIFSIREFTWEYESYRSKFGKTISSSLDAETLLRILYHFSVIGNIGKGNHQIYSYNTHVKRLNMKTNICIHRGLLKALEMGRQS